MPDKRRVPTMIRKLIAAMRGTTQAAASSANVEYPLELEARVSALHARAPVRRHLEILYGDVSIGGEPFVDLYFRCLEETGTVLTPFTVFHRFQTRHDLLRYFLATLELPGGRIECGAYRGATALLLCRAWRSRHGEFDGRGFFLVDSFSGTSASTARDLIAVRDEQGNSQLAPFFPTGKTDASVEAVRERFGEFPRAEIRQGWVPQVLEALPEQPWAFVHIDLTLYEPTLAALEYFHPRLPPGGVIICDGSAFCPGVQAALDEFSARHDAAYASLGHREAVFLKA